MEGNIVINISDVDEQRTGGARKFDRQKFNHKSGDVCITGKYCRVRPTQGSDTFRSLA